jgi:hypothetical protein
MPSGKLAPVDAEPSPIGTIRISNDAAEVLTGKDRRHALDAGVELFLSHFATCPDREDWRRA